MSDKRLSVLVLIDSLGLGGAESLLVHFARIGPSLGLDVQVAAVVSRSSGRTQMVDALSEAGSPPVFLNVDRLLSRHALPRVISHIRASGCDVIHANLGYAMTLAVPAGALLRRPTFCTFHAIPGEPGWRSRVKDRLFIEIASQSAACIFVSEAMRRAFARLYSHRHGNWKVIRNGIDLSMFDGRQAALPSELGVPQGAPVAIMPAALRPGKGHALAIDAWTQVRARVPDARLLIVGSGDLEAALRQRVADRGLTGSVVFAGFRTDVNHLLAASTLVALASEYECLPTALMEGAAAGLPAVATDVGGTNEVVEDGTTGVLVPSGRADLFGAAVADLLENRDRCQRMGAAAFGHARAHFSATTWVSRLRELYLAAPGSCAVS